MKINPFFTSLAKSVLVFLFGMVLFCACGGNPSSEAPALPATGEEPTTNKEDEAPAEKPEPANEAPQPESMTTLKQNEKVFAWVDRLNIRDAANLKGKQVASATEQEALEFTGEKSTNAETIVLRGVAYTEPWLKVKTSDGKEGWVFGGAVKREGETKGNGPISDDSFFYPHFGRFDLSTWKKTNSKDESGGDADIDVSTYTKDGRTLEVTKADVGEYRYSRAYKLMENDGKVLKTRTFAFEGDGLNELTETVNVYSSNPSRKYTRTQKVDKHFMRLNERPVMVNGTWVESEADAQ